MEAFQERGRGSVFKGHLVLLDTIKCCKYFTISDTGFLHVLTAFCSQTKEDLRAVSIVESALPPPCAEGDICWQRDSADGEKPRWHPALELLQDCLSEKKKGIMESPDTCIVILRG